MRTKFPRAKSQMIFIKSKNNSPLIYFYKWPFKRQTQKMVKQTQAICRQFDLGAKSYLRPNLRYSFPKPCQLKL